VTNYTSPNMITPPKETDEIFPYRRVWLSIIIEYGILSAVVGVLFVPALFLGFRLPDDVHQPVNIMLALLPAILWYLFSRRPENAAAEPRERLSLVFVLSMLVANAIGIPLVDGFIRPDTWLLGIGTLDRLLGYALTVGVIHELLRYLILRYTVWPGRYNTRLDGIAYAAACATGYATVLNMSYVLTNVVPPDVAILRIFSITTLSLVGSLVVSFGMVQTIFTPRPHVLLLAGSLAVASLITGAAVPLRAELVNAPLGLTISATRPLFGIALSFIIFVGMTLVVAFFYRAADQRELDALRSKEV